MKLRRHWGSYTVWGLSISFQLQNVPVCKANHSIYPLPSKIRGYWGRQRHEERTLQSWLRERPQQRPIEFGSTPHQAPGNLFSSMSQIVGSSFVTHVPWIFKFLYSNLWVSSLVSQERQPQHFLPTKHLFTPDRSSIFEGHLSIITRHDYNI